MTSHCFTLIGDSNVRRHVSRISRRTSQAIKDCETISCGSIELFEASLSKVRKESTICVISCVTNFLASAVEDDSSSASQRVDPVLQRFRTLLLNSCKLKPNRSFMVSPPMYRTTPVWYRDGLPEILSAFSSVLCDDRPPNLHLLASFATPEYEADGIHLTAFSGLEFVLSLFDDSEALLEHAAKEPQVRCDLNAEDTRFLKDRMMVLEQDHRRLNSFVEKKSAVDAELADYRENERFEDWLVISGLPSLPSSLSGKEWQDQAIRSVKKVLNTLMGRETEIVVVQNVTSRQKDAEVTYNVKMSSVEESRSIRRKFGSFFKGSEDGRPEIFKSISIKNRITADTRIRISLLKLMAKRYKDSNPGSKVQVIGYDTRPLLKIIPPAGSTDRRTKVFNYVEACRSLPSFFSASDIDPVLRRVHPSHRGNIRATFIVISDDMVPTKGSKPITVTAEGDTALPEPGKGRGVRRAAPSPPGSPSAKR